jgi:hypothetical protein
MSCRDSRGGDIRRFLTRFPFGQGSSDRGGDCEGADIGITFLSGASLTNSWPFRIGGLY